MINDPLQECGLLPLALVAKVDPSDNEAFRDTAGKIVVDQRESGEVGSVMGQNRLFHQRDYGFVSIGPRGRPGGRLFGVRGANS
jgi:hypothetical protein